MKSLDRRIQAVIEVNEPIGGPEPLAQLFSSHDFSGSLPEGNQQLKGLLLQLYPQSAALELAGLQPTANAPKRTTHVEESAGDPPGAWQEFKPRFPAFLASFVSPPARYLPSTYRGLQLE